MLVYANHANLNLYVYYMLIMLIHKLPTKKVKQISLSFSLTTWEHSLFSSLHFILLCFHLGITNLQGLKISQHGFFNTNVAIELPSEYDWNCTTKEPKFICAF